MRKKIKSIFLALILSISMIMSTTLSVFAEGDAFDEWMMTCLSTALLANLIMQKALT